MTATTTDETTIDQAMNNMTLSKDDDVAVETAELEQAQPEKEKEQAEAEEEEEEEVSLYDEPNPERIVVGRSFPLSFYVDRARRILRIGDDLYIDGRGENIATACKLVESLKRQKVAITTKISTGMNVEPYFTAQGDVNWAVPVAAISFTLVAGEYAKYIADYQQRKIVEIFEHQDEKCDGLLSMDKVKELDLLTKFKANKEQIEEANKFLSDLSEDCIDLPNFVKYASICIHPLLKNRMFKEILSGEFGLSVSGFGRAEDKKENEEDKDIDEAEELEL